MATYYAEASGTLGLWVRSNGTWTKCGTMPYYGNGSYGSGGMKTVYFYASATITAPGGIDAFRVTLDSQDSGGSGVITAINGVSWVTQSSSGSRSATPNGEKITATVRPQ